MLLFNFIMFLIICFIYNNFNIDFYINTTNKHDYFDHMKF